MKAIKTLVALGLMAGSMAMAATATGTVTITASVGKTCSISTAPTALAFGNYDVYSTAATTSTSTFGVKCTKGTSYTMKLSGGDASGVRTFTTAPAGSALKYSLAYGTTPWGDGTSGSANGVTATSTSAAETTYTINGSIAAGQDVAQGTYSDTVNLTIDY